MGDTEEIVMTAAKKNGKATMRLERVFKSEIDGNKVHHFAGGPYKGILINKATDQLDNVEPAEGRLEFLAYLVNEEKNDQTLQDYWTLRFWFRGKADGLVKKNTFTNYFQELMSPSDFPKNYIGFIKKALILLKAYPVIKRVDLEVQQSEEPSPEDIPPFSSFTTIFTPAGCSYMCVPEVPVKSKTFLTFMIKAGGDVCLALSAVYGDSRRKTHEIIIGAEQNTKSYIRECANGPVKMEALTMNILSSEEFRYFWINWADNHLEVGRGAQYGYGRFLHWHVPPEKQFHVNCLQVCTGKASRGQWEFAELLDPDEEKGRLARRKRIRETYMWLARKQKLLQYLEEAYPNVVSSAVLLRHCRVKRSDMVTAAVILGDLQRRGLIKEVQEGHWMRIQGGGSSAAPEDVQLVKIVPHMSSGRQPTIAIITSLYCEKLAVDALIEDKTTFVKCKTEGESQVYTTGRIGQHRVVSTKLSCLPGTAQTSNISAENTVTRLLGTFNKVEHVFLIGVGMAVPHFTDPTKHVRLGDVVVSMPTENTDAQYIICTALEKADGIKKFNFKTKKFKSQDTTLLSVVDKIRQEVDLNPDNQKPWDRYVEEANAALNVDDSMFQRPTIETDKLFQRKSDGSLVLVKHPIRDQDGSNELTIKYGLIGSGKLIGETEDTLSCFAGAYEIKTFDGDFEAVLDSLEGNRNESFLIIRGMANYFDGVKKEWQPFASVVAAAYMKAVIMALE